ncbi:uncharacterized protein BDV14DRAFT_84724 [Aspergillus stella-maris]|uniref:uncharacterized protein n=1 Tax=Aspergillus stella-maris TaxID=1810926 RepID=UPI003CCDE19E
MKHLASPFMNLSPVPDFSDEKKSASILAAELEQAVLSWVKKYAAGDMAHLADRKTSSEQWQKIIEGAKGYCAQCPLDTLKLISSDRAYDQIPSLLAHAVVNKSLWELVENSFYYLDQKFESGLHSPHLRTPPEGFAVYLRELFSRMNTSRQDDAVKCRQLMLRAITATKAFQTNKDDLGVEVGKRKENAHRHLVKRLLDDSNSPLQPLLKDICVSAEQRTEMLELFARASELSILCGITDKELQFRSLDELPLYDYGGQQDRLMSPHYTTSSAAAQ